MEHQYLALKNELQTSIIDGKYRPGDTLPSENELKSKYALSRFTIRQALDELEKEGFIIRLKGKGSIVMNRKRKSLGIFSIEGFTAIARHQGDVRTEFLREPYSVNWDQEFFHELSAEEIKYGAICYERLRSVGEEPLMLEYTYIPKHEIPAIKKGEFVNESLFETLSDLFGILIKKAHQELVATGASKKVASLLNVKPGTSILHVHRKYITNKANFYIYSSFYFNTATYSIGEVLE